MLLSFLPLVAVLTVACGIAYICRQPVVKGKFGEFLVKLFFRFNLDKNVYQVINDVMLPDGNGGTTQIDHIVLSPYGIFVVETKNIQGWIFGGQHDEKWTQQLYRTKHQFQNPLRQNYKHIRCLAELSGLPAEYFIHTIVFTGNCTLKTREQLPASVVTKSGELANFIESYKQVVLTDEMLEAVKMAINGNTVTNTFANRREHVKHVKEIIGNKTATIAAADEFPEPPEAPVADEFPEPPDAPAPPAAPVTPQQDNSSAPRCPRCGGVMVFRQAKTGSNAGKSFWGCSRYPACRGIINCE